MNYIEWLEEALLDMEPDWVCEQLNNIGGDYCERNCSNTRNDECLFELYQTLRRRSESEYTPNRDCPWSEIMGEQGGEMMDETIYKVFNALARTGMELNKDISLKYENSKSENKTVFGGGNSNINTLTMTITSAGSIESEPGEEGSDELETD